MKLAQLLGWTALLITIVYTCVGLPSQIRRNHATKSTMGLSLFMIVMLTLTFTAWLAYGLAASPRNWFLVGSNVPGAFFVVVILYQFWIYRNRSRGKPAA
ncbi:MAG: SWEET family sugar transporter [Candidatus Krumholzibacteria bacterium]|nr:SWEET family sugar transporter [Candidatus Krumholzibacteria bacterium]